MSFQQLKEKRNQLEDIDRDFAIDLAAPSVQQNRMPDRPLPRSLLLGINLGLHGTGGSGDGTGSESLIEAFIEWYGKLTTEDLDPATAGLQTVADPTDNPAIILIKGVVHEINEWWDAVSTGFINWWESPDLIAEPFNTIREIGRTIWEAVNGVFTWYEELVTLERTDSEGVTFYIADEDDNAAVKIIKGLIYEIDEWVAGVTKWWEETTEPIIVAIRTIGQTVWEIIEGISREIWNAIDGVFEWYDELDDGHITYLSPSDSIPVKIIKGLIHETAAWLAGVTKWWEETDNAIVMAIRGIDEAVWGVIEDISKSIWDAIDGVFTWYDGLTQYDNIDDTTDVPTRIVRGLIHGAADWIETVADLVSETIDDVVVNLTNLLKNDEGGFGAFYEGLTGDEEDSDDTFNPAPSNTLNDVLKSIGAGLLADWVGLVGWYNKIVDGVGDLFTDPVAFFEGISSDVTGFFKDDTGPLGAFYEGLTEDETGADGGVNPTLDNTALNINLKALGTNLRIAWNTVYGWFFNPAGVITINTDFLDEIGGALVAGASNLGDGITKFLFGDKTPSAFATDKAGEKIDTELASGGDILVEINDKLLDAFTDFGNRLQDGIVAFAQGVTPVLSGVFDFFQDLFVTIFQGEDGLGGTTDSTASNIDLKNADLKNVDRIFFSSDQTDPEVAGQPKPLISGHNNDMFFTAPVGKAFRFIAGNETVLSLHNEPNRDKIINCNLTSLIGIGAGTVSDLGELSATNLDADADYLMILDSVSTLPTTNPVIRKIKASALGGGSSSFDPLNITSDLDPAVDEEVNMGSTLAGRQFRRIFVDDVFAYKSIQLQPPDPQVTIHINGAMWLNGGDIMVYSGDEEVSLSDIFSPLSVPNNLLPGAVNYKLGASNKAWSEIFGRELRLVGTPSSTPTENGAIWLDSSDIKVRSGGDEVSLSDIGTGGGDSFDPGAMTEGLFPTFSDRENLNIGSNALPFREIWGNSLRARTSLRFNTNNIGSNNEGSIWYDGTNLKAYIDSGEVTLSGGAGSIDLGAITQDIVPAADDARELGSDSNRFDKIYTRVVRLGNNPGTSLTEDGDMWLGLLSGGVRDVRVVSGGMARNLSDIGTSIDLGAITQDIVPANDNDVSLGMAGAFAGAANTRFDAIYTSLIRLGRNAGTLPNGDMWVDFFGDVMVTSGDSIRNLSNIGSARSTGNKVAVTDLPIIPFSKMENLDTDRIVGTNSTGRITTSDMVSRRTLNSAMTDYNVDAGSIEARLAALENA